MVSREVDYIMFVCCHVSDYQICLYPLHQSVARTAAHLIGNVCGVVDWRRVAENVLEQPRDHTLKKYDVDWGCVHNEWHTNVISNIVDTQQRRQVAGDSVVYVTT